MSGTCSNQLKKNSYRKRQRFIIYWIVISLLFCFIYPRTIKSISNSLHWISSFLLLFGGLFGQCALDARILMQDINQIAILMHLQENIAAANEFSSDKDLWDCWPAAEVFNSLTQLLIQQNIVRVVLDTVHAEDLHDGIGEAALWRVRISLKSNTIGNSLEFHIQFWEFHFYCWTLSVSPS